MSDLICKNRQQPVETNRETHRQGAFPLPLLYFCLIAVCQSLIQTTREISSLRLFCRSLFLNLSTLIEYHAVYNTDIATMFEHLVNIGILEQTNLFSFVSTIIVIINLNKFVLSIYLVHFIFI